MRNLPLRLRVFLFFCLVAAGSVAVVLAAVWLGYRQLAQPDALSAFVTVAVVSAFGVPALATFVWLLFDTNVSKPIEAIAARLRVGTHTNADVGIDDELAPYLGDLAPAAAALHQKLAALASDGGQGFAADVERLRRHRLQLVQILSDLPNATLLISRDHHVVLYDGQAADLMASEAPVRLNGSVFDYLQEGSVRKALSLMGTEDRRRRTIAVTGHSGAVYSGYIRVFENGCYALMLEPLEVDASRPLVYDLDLLDREASQEASDTALRELSVVAFDTETTGLDPARDDVVQIGAVRIVNGKIVPGETFERLVDPGRPIPPHSSEVHGIDDDMVAGAPPFSEVSAEFHRFATGAVLLAHNAPFDMAFLRRAAETNGAAFENPVIDTVHISAIVFGGSATHTLDALCERLEITIPFEDRHTATGDAVATARAFAAMLPILEARGIRTLGALREECRKHQRILETA
ncbi:3'-5' exonuclease [Jannaschia aquimarina]|uniref:DNA-directed DNA polymerase n=1 Tax=Jannaschia aquimarina TaxID=935700 RepID=A0A0D1EFV8_9RHOB|nr:3'-5' exonuclease [Jannaschia aquimarina]KIT14745.1 DNA polymerase III PolC-type [Jannaschia aquimarina]SNS76387.1 DNA polymerase-3 subunit epsilon [Jannaschia aquimarina]